MATTTTATFDTDLIDATQLLIARLDVTVFPEGEVEKAASDALNNTWVEGVTVEQWVTSAATTLSRPTV